MKFHVSVAKVCIGRVERAYVKKQIFLVKANLRMEYNKTFQSQAKHMPLGIIYLTPLSLGSYPACVFDMCYIKPFFLFPYVTDGLITCLCRLCSGVSKSLFLFTTLLYDPYVMDFCLCVCFG